MIVTTTPSIEGHAIRDYRGIVIGEVIVGANLFRDLFASITDIVGGRSGKYENVLKRARDEALAEMEAEAEKVGANAVVGVDIDYEVVGEKGIDADGIRIRNRSGGQLKHIRPRKQHIDQSTGGNKIIHHVHQYIGPPAITDSGIAPDQTPDQLRQHEGQQHGWGIAGIVEDVDKSEEQRLAPKNQGENLTIPCRHG